MGRSWEPTTQPAGERAVGPLANRFLPPSPLLFSSLFFLSLLLASYVFLFPSLPLFLFLFPLSRVPLPTTEACVCLASPAADAPRPLPAEAALAPGVSPPEETYRSSRVLGKPGHHRTVS